MKKSRSSYHRPLRGLQSLAPRLLLAGDLQSAYQPLDTNSDARVSAADAIVLINLLQEDSTQNAGPGIFPDVNGNGYFSPLDLLIVINHFEETNLAARLVNDSSIPGETNYDLYTNDLGLEIWASDFLDEVELTINGQTFDDLAEFESSGRLLLGSDAIDGLLANPLPDGTHEFEIRLPQRATPLNFQITVDRTAPQPILKSDEGRLRLQQDYVDFLLTEPMTFEAVSESDFEIQLSNASDTSQAIQVLSVNQGTDHRVTLQLDERLSNGEYTITLPPLLCDRAGNLINTRTFPFLVEQTAGISIDPVSQFVTIETSHKTISTRWDVAAQKAVVATSPGPTVASRAYAMTHTAMYNAWSAYDEAAISTFENDDLQRPGAENTDVNKAAAMSYAAYRVLVDLFPSVQSLFDDLMAELGYDPSNQSTDTTTPAGIGNTVAADLLAFRHTDGSNQLGDSVNGNGLPYSDVTDYSPTNAPGNTLSIDVWTPEHVPIDATPETLDHIQQFLTPHWGQVLPFGLTSPSQFRPQAPQPFLLVEGTVDLNAKTITLQDGSSLDIDRSLIGSIINPEFIAQAEHVIEASGSLTDEQKMIAEFWEDAKDTSFPPGTWMTFGQFVSGRDEHTLDQDAQFFFILSNAIFDASIATWDAKVFYDYARPVRVIRELGKLGLIGEYDPTLNGHVIDAWMPETGSTQTILASEFLTYQTPGSDPSPPFAEYTSGHSSFSAAGATVLELFTGDAAFGGEVSFQPGESRFEPGRVPAETVTLHWTTFRDAADEAGLSRIYGGIHFSEGDLRGRTMGNEVARAVWERAEQLFNGNANET